MNAGLDINILKKLGKFTNELKTNVREIIVEGAKASQIVDYIEGNIFKKGYLPAFPCTVCINDVAAHYTVFDDDIVIRKGDVVKVDFGVSENGQATDTAFTVEVGTDKYKNMLDANNKALDEQMELIDYGTKMFELGKIPEMKANEINCQTIHNLSGHQVEKNNLHAGLQVPNYDNRDTREVAENMSLAIEPYFSCGSTRIKNSKSGNILQLLDSKPIRDIVAKKVLMYIKKNYPYLPFSKRWLLKDVAERLGLEGGFNMKQVVYAVNILKKYNIIYEHDMLVSTDGSVNSQFEDTVVFHNGEKIVITRL